MKSLEKLPKCPVTKTWYGPYELSSSAKVDPGSQIEFFRAILDVRKDLFGARLHEHVKTGKRFVLSKTFAADEAVRSEEWPRLAVSTADDHAGNDALEEARTDLVNVISNIEKLVKRVLA